MAHASMVPLVQPYISGGQGDYKSHMMAFLAGKEGGFRWPARKVLCLTALVFEQFGVSSDSAPTVVAD